MTKPAMWGRVLAGLWCLAVVFIYGRLWWHSPKLLPNWPQTLLAGPRWYLLHLAAMAALLGLLALLKSSARTRAWTLGMFWLASFVALLQVAAEPARAWTIVLWGAWLLACGEGCRVMWEQRGWGRPSLAVGVALALVFMEGVLFLAGLCGLASQGLRLALACALPLAAVIGLAIQPALLRQRLRLLETGLSPASAIFAEMVFLVTCLGLLHAYVPETLADAAILHIPKSAIIGASPNLAAMGQFPYQPFTLITPFVHIVFSVPLTLGGQIALKAVTWVLAPVMASAMVGICQRLRVGGSRAWAAAALFLAMPVYIWHYGCGYIDITAALLSVSAVAALLEIKEQEAGAMAWAMLCGALFGAAIAAKLTVIPFAMAFLLCWVVWSGHTKGGSPGRLSLPMLWTSVGLGVALIALPHLAFEYHLTGNPFYPALSGIFPSPYWNNAIDAGAVQRFHDIPWWGWLAWPYSLVMHTSWFGSDVENVDGSAGLWFLLFFPLALLAIRRWRELPALRVLAAGAFLYLVVMALLGSAYMRYYIQQVPLLFCLMAAGSPDWERRGARGTWYMAGIGLLLGGLSLAQFTFPTVWSPSIDHWRQYRQGTPMQWLEKHYPGFQDLMGFLDTLPPQTRLIAFNADYACHLPRTTNHLRSPDVIFSGTAGFNTQAALELGLNRDLWKFLRSFERGELSRMFDQGELDKILADHGDLLLVTKCDDLDFLARSRFLTLDRLVYAAPAPEGPLPWTILLFSMNDRLFPPITGQAPPVEDAGQDGDAWLWPITLAPGGSRVLASLRWREMEIAPPYPQVQAHWRDADGLLLRSQPVRVFYGRGKANAYLMTDTPPGARQLSLNSSVPPSQPDGLLK